MVEKLVMKKAVLKGALMVERWVAEMADKMGYQKVALMELTTVEKMDA